MFSVYFRDILFRPQACRATVDHSVALRPDRKQRVCPIGQQQFGLLPQPRLRWMFDLLLRVDVLKMLVDGSHVM